MNSQTRKI